MTHNHKKVLFVSRPLSPPWDEGSKNFAYDLAKNLSDVSVTILTAGTSDDLPTHLTQKPIYTRSDLSFPIMQKLRLLFFLWRHAKDYDVVHLFFTTSRLNSFILSRLIPRRTHVIQTIATLRDNLYSTKTLRKLYFGQALVTYSQYAKQRLQKILADQKRPHQRITHIYPGINMEKYHPTDKDPVLMKKWRLTKKHFVVMYPGEFVRLGATDLIVNAFMKLWSDPANAHIRYLCACRIKNNADARKKNEVIERFRAAGHLDKVIFTDNFHGDMNTLYNLSDLVIFPVVSMAGKFDVPLAMIEPYACKKCVIASDLPILHEFSTDDINVIIPTNHPAKLTEMIQSIAHNPADYTNRAEAAYRFAHATFDITTIAKQYTNLYAQL